MKIRQGFVSNSSSSSFVIKKKYLTSTQIEAIRNHFEVAQIYYDAIYNLKDNLYKAGYNLEEMNDLEIFNLNNFYIPESSYDKWDITETDDELKGSTGLDNFDMDHFLGLIGVGKEHVNFKYY